MKPREWVAFLVLGLTWGSSFLWIKIAVQEVGPFTLVAFRLLFGALGLLAVVLTRRPRLPANRQLWLAMVVLGVTNTAVPFVLISWGEQFIDSGVASILNATVPLFTMLIAHFFLHDERITRMRAFGLVVGFAGILVLFGREPGAQGAGSSRLLGELAGLAAAVSYAGSSVFARRVLRNVSPLLQATVTVAVADGLVWLAVPLVESPFRAPSTPLTWFALAWLGLLGSCLAYVLYYFLIQNVGSTRTTMVTYLLPVIGVALGVVFLGEQLSARLALGTALVIAGIWVVTTNWRPRFVFGRHPTEP